MSKPCRLFASDKDPADEGPNPLPRLDEMVDALAPVERAVTVIRLTPRRTVVTSPRGSVAVCRVDLDRPLAVSAALGQLMRMEDDAAPDDDARSVLVERQVLVRYEAPEPPLVFDLFGPEPLTGEWGSDTDDDARIFAQIAGRS